MLKKELNKIHQLMIITFLGSLIEWCLIPIENHLIIKLCHFDVKKASSIQSFYKSVISFFFLFSGF
jgi:hypothetical protein